MTQHCLLLTCLRASVLAAAGSPPSRWGTVQQGGSAALLAARVTQLWRRSVPSSDEALRPAPARPRAATGAAPTRPDAAAGRGRPDVSRPRRSSEDARDGAGTGRPGGGRPARSSGDLGEARATRAIGGYSCIVLSCTLGRRWSDGLPFGRPGAYPSGRGRDSGARKRGARRGVSAGRRASGGRARCRCGSAWATCSAGRTAGGACPRGTGTTPT